MARPRQISDERILAVARRLFLERGGGVPTAEIARELGISQAVLFQRFVTKEQLLLAALAPPRDVPWITAAEAGPDERPIRDQLLALGEAITAFFEELAPRIAVLRTCGFDRPRWPEGEVPPPVRAHRALTGWLVRAQAAGRIAPCDPVPVVDVLLGSLQFRPWFEHAVGRTPIRRRGRRAHVAAIVDLVWRTLAPPTARPPRPHRPAGPGRRSR